MSFHARLDVFFDLSTQRATLNSELDTNANEALGRNRDVAHHA